MKIFYWRSKAVSDWSNGHLITLANDVKEAKENIRDAMRLFAKNHYDYLFDKDGNLLEEERELYEGIFKDLEKDLSKNPVNDHTVIILGSM